MKAHKSQPKRVSSLNQLLNRRLLSYATAATAAGVGVVGMAPPAEAQIVFTPAHVMIGAHTFYPLDLANNGTVDFILHGSITANCSTVFSALLAKPVPGNAVDGGIYLGLGTAKALNPAQRIGSSQRFISRGRGGVLMGEAIYSPGGGQYRGQWVHVTNRYLGLKFQINGETHFGWARMSAQLSLSKPIKSILTGYAYETQPNTPIVAGQESGQADDVLIEPRAEGESNPDAPAADASPSSSEAPPPASLGVLALGAAGLRLWR